MSSEISTKEVRPKADAVPDPGLQPWQFFVLAALGCATAVTFIARGQGPAAIILLSILMATAALVGYAALRMLRPLVSPEDDRTAMIGQRTRVALEREKMLSLRSIKELEFDRAMGRLSDEDWKEMSGRLRVRAARLIRQLDAGVGYRAQIERELAKRLGDSAARLKPARSEDEDPPARLTPSRYENGADARSAKASAERRCAACDTENDTDARFCKSCGKALGAA
jgi:hypothetical protein